MKTEVLVVGSGIGGAMAAHSARAEGREVALVAKGYGATALSGGALDLQGTLTRGGKIRNTPVEAAEIRAEEDQGHPYALVKRWGEINELSLADIIERSLGMAVEFIKSGGGPHYLGEPSGTLMLPNVAGTWKDTCLCQETMVGSDLLSLEGASILVAGIHGYNDFPQEFIANSLKETADMLGEGDRIRSISSRAVSIPKTVDFNLVSFGLAASLEVEKTRDEFKKVLEEAVKDSGSTPTHLFLPAVLGRKGSADIARELGEALGCTVCEVVATRASVPGYRLFRALEASYEPARINYVYGEVKDWEEDGSRLKSVAVESSGRETEIEFDALVLATGKMIGGGLVAGDRVRESIFSFPLDVPCPGRKSTVDLPTDKLLEKDIFDDQPLFRVGIRCSEKFRVQVKGNVVYENLFACGALLGGTNHAWEKNGMGVAITTGYAAGKCASASTA